MRSETGTCDRRDFSRSPEDPNRLAVDPGRLILGTFAPLAPRFRRLSYISDNPPINRSLAPRMLSDTESGDRRDFSRFHADPDRLAVDPRRLIPGPSAHSCLVFADFRTFPTRARLISLLHRECVRKPKHAIAGISRVFLKILTDWPSIRAA